MGTYLLKYGFSGVQDLISQARKLRDLRTGSWLLSSLSQFVAESPPTVGISELRRLLPVHPDSACPHQGVFEIVTEAQAGDAVRPFAQSLEARAHSALLRLAEAHRWPKALLPGATRQLVDPQLLASLDLYWVAVPRDDDLRTSLVALQTAFEARRHTRTFSQLPDPEPAVPSSLACAQCGQRVAIARPAARVGDWDERDQHCALCAAKRWLGSTNFRGFPSTQRLAHDRLLWDTRVTDAWTELSTLGLDIDHLAGSERDDLKTEITEAGETQRAALERALTLLWGGDRDRSRRGLFSYASPYYALIRFDGDRMGEWFSGVRFAEHVDTERALHDLGERLAVTAASISAVVKPHRGQVVYLGGDDGFLLTPLDGCLRVMRAIRDTWTETVKPLAAVAASGRAPTLSLHASVVHMKEPLQPVVQSLQRSLDETKDACDRSAFSIEVSPRAGSSAVFRGKWPALDGLIGLVEAFSDWCADDFEAGKPVTPPTTTLATRRRAAWPTRLLYKVGDSTPAVFDQEGQLVLPDALAWELGRLFDRSADKSPKFQAAGSPALAFLGQRALGTVAEAPATGKAALLQTIEVAAFLSRELRWRNIP
jgi:hypothetical protein